MSVDKDNIKLKTIVNAIAHGLHYNMLRIMIDETIDYNTSNIGIKNKVTLLYSLHYNKNETKIKYKPFNFNGNFNELAEIIKNDILENFEILKNSKYTYFVFSDGNIKRLETNKLNIDNLPEIEKIDCELNNTDIVCFLYYFLKKLSLYETFYKELDFENYRDVYNTFVNDKMYLFADLINEIFMLDEKAKYNSKIDDKTYTRLIKYSSYLIKID